MNIKNRPFDPTLLIKTTLPEESGDTINYEYRHCDIEETIESEDDYVCDEIRHPFSILVPNRPFTGKTYNYIQKLNVLTLPNAG